MTLKMGNDTDIRWKQRLQNYERALKQRRDAVSLMQSRPLSMLEKQGLIQSFEFTHELAWQLMKDYFAYQGNTAIMGSRDAIRTSFKAGLIDEGEIWMEMIKSRNKSSHTYNQQVADEIVTRVQTDYLTPLEALLTTMQGISRQDGN